MNWLLRKLANTGDLRNSQNGTRYISIIKNVLILGVYNLFHNLYLISTREH